MGGHEEQMMGDWMETLIAAGRGCRRWRWPAPALAGDRAGDFVNVPAAKNPRTWWYFFLLFLRSFLLVGVGQLSSVFLYGLPVCVRVFVRFLNL